LGCSIVIMGPLLRSCVEVRTAIELSFGVMSGVGPGIDVLDGGSMCLKGKGCFWHFSAFAPRNIFDSCMKS